MSGLHFRTLLSFKSGNGRSGGSRESLRILQGWRHRLATVVVMCIAFSPLSLLGSAGAQAAISTFQTGEVFASVGNGTVNVYNPTTGSLLTALNDGTGEPYTAGGAFDASNDYYVTDDFTGDVSEYNSSGTLLPQFATGLQSPLSLSFDSSGNLYVGQQITPYVAEFNSSGVRLPDIGPMNTELYGVDWIDLAADQCTLYYTTEGTDILRYNKCTNTQLPNFNVTPFSGGAAYDLRIRPNGEVLVADSNAVLLLNSAGSVIQTYPCSSLPGCANKLFAVNLDPNGTSFWTGDSYSGNIWQISIATGQVLQTINTASGVLYGLAVNGEITVATNSATTLSVNATTGASGAPITASAVLTNSSTSAPIAGEPVTLTLNGSETCTATTNSAGVASCSITPSETAGTYTLTAAFGGDSTQAPGLSATTGSNNLVVTTDQTAFAYTGATSAQNGQPVTLSGVLTTNVPSPGTAVGGQPIVFTLGSGSTAQSCSATTNSSGIASCTIASVNQPTGSTAVGASFGGNTVYSTAGATTSVTTTPATSPTTLSVNAAAGGSGTPTTLSAVLTNSTTSAPISGEPVTFTLNGTQTCTGTTSSTGVASCSVTPSEPAGTYTLTAAFGGDTTQSPQLLTSSASTTLVVTHDATSLKYTGATSAINGQSVTLSGVLTTSVPSAGTSLSGQTVVFTLGSGSTAQSCSGTTNSSGSASCTIATVNQPTGSTAVGASFGGNTFYSPSSASASANVTATSSTTLTVTAASGSSTVSTTVSAVLTNSKTAVAISGQTVTLTLNGTQTCTGTTGSTGKVSCSITPAEGAGTYTLTAAFAGNTTTSPQLLSSSGSAGFVVTHDVTYLTYTGGTSAMTGQSVTLSGTLSVDNPSVGTALVGQVIVFTLGSGSTAQSCSATTNSHGSASCTIASVNQASGSIPVTASFAGTTVYGSISTSSKVSVTVCKK